MIVKMAKYRNAGPPELLDDEDDEWFVNDSAENLREQREGNFAIKVIKPLGLQCGLNKRNFDISLDDNSQQWFNQIYQYWKQCESVIFIKTQFSKLQKIHR